MPKQFELVQIDGSFTISLGGFLKMPDRPAKNKTMLKSCTAHICKILSQLTQLQYSFCFTK